MNTRTLEWIGCDDAGETIARVVRIHGPWHWGWRTLRAVARDAEARIVELPLQAVRTAEAALG